MVLMLMFWVEEGKFFNGVVLFEGGKVVVMRIKVYLLNYGVFDEFWVFEFGFMLGFINFKGVCFGVMICEDMWEDDVVECL